MNHCSALTIGIDATALVEKPTGVGNYIGRLLTVLCERHPDVAFALLSNGPIHFPGYPNVQKHISQPRRRGPYWQNTQLLAMLRKVQPDIYWAGNGLLPFLMPPGIATLVTVHDMVYRFAPHTIPLLSRWGRRLTQKHSVLQAHCVVAVSQATATDVSDHYGRVPDAIISPPLDAAFRRPEPAEVVATVHRYGLPEHYLLVLGTLEPRKNIATLLDAYLHCRQYGAALPTLVIVGARGWKDRGICERIKHASALGYVQPLGYVPGEHLPALYAGCQAFLMPSLYEGFGMPILEAQACGAAVVHGPHPAMSEAAGGVGVRAGDVSFQGLCQLLHQLAQGTLPLVCRLPADIPSAGAAASAEQLMELLLQALHRSRGGV